MENLKHNWHCGIRTMWQHNSNCDNIKNIGTADTQGSQLWILNSTVEYDPHPIQPPLTYLRKISIYCYRPISATSSKWFCNKILYAFLVSLILITCPVNPAEFLIPLTSNMTWPIEIIKFLLILENPHCDATCSSGPDIFLAICFHTLGIYVLCSYC
jgi:hypothetical protein